MSKHIISVFTLVVLVSFGGCYSSEDNGEKVETQQLGFYETIPALEAEARMCGGGHFRLYVEMKHEGRRLVPGRAFCIESPPVQK